MWISWKWTDHAVQTLPKYKHNASVTPKGCIVEYNLNWMPSSDPCCTVYNVCTVQYIIIDNSKT